MMVVKKREKWEDLREAGVEGAALGVVVLARGDDE